MMTKANRINDMAVGDLRPEKAGVGGSIPSLATTFSITQRWSWISVFQAHVPETSIQIYVWCELLHKLLKE